MNLNRTKMLCLICQWWFNQFFTCLFFVWRLGFFFFKSQKDFFVNAPGSMKCRDNFLISLLGNRFGIPSRRVLYNNPESRWNIACFLAVIVWVLPGGVERNAAVENDFITNGGCNLIDRDRAACCWICVSLCPILCYAIGSCKGDMLL